MDSWWSMLNLPHKVFYAIGIVTSFVLLCQLALTFLGFDGVDDAGDADTEGSDVSVLSTRTMTAFFVGFGWGGIAILESGRGVVTSTLGGVAVGTAMMLGVYVLMRVMHSMRYDGTINYTNAVGGSATVYLPIPASMSAPGMVEVQVQGRVRTVQAFTRAGERIPNGARVRVIDTLDQQTLLVEPASERED